LTLLGLGSQRELAALRRMPAPDLRVGIIERLMIVLEMFHLISTLRTVSESIEDWIRAIYRAPPFSGRSALQMMLERDLAGMNMVCAYLRDQFASSSGKYQRTRLPRGGDPWFS
jgi:hypothetical protein